MEATPRTVLWRRLDLPGHEVCTIARRDDGWRLSGTALFVHHSVPCEFAYEIFCAADWRTRSAEIAGRVGRRDVRLDVSADGEGRWSLQGAEIPEVDGCLDIDLGFTPSTNLLPIRRLSLIAGESAEVVAAWLPFPSLTFEPLRQVYRRESEGTYRYESGDGAFVRTLQVDGLGMVTRYPGLWEMEAAT